VTTKMEIETKETIVKKRTRGNDNITKYSSPPNQSKRKFNDAISFPPPRKKRKHKLLAEGMATALSLDHWSAPASSNCLVKDSPDLSVSFLCMHPRHDDDDDDNDDDHEKEEDKIISKEKKETHSKEKYSNNAFHHPFQNPSMLHAPPQMNPNSTRKQQIQLNDNSINSSSSTPQNKNKNNVSSPPPLATAARYQEIFVDLCTLHAASFDAASRHVLDERFDSFLGEGEHEFKSVMLRFISSEGLLSSKAKETSAYRRLERMLRKEMGLDGIDSRTQLHLKRMQGLRRDSSFGNAAAAAAATATSAAAHEGESLSASSSSQSLTSSSTFGQEEEQTVSNHAFPPISFSSSSSSSKLLPLQNANHHHHHPGSASFLPTTPRITNSSSSKHNAILQQLIHHVKNNESLFRQFALLRPSRHSPMVNATQIISLFQKHFGEEKDWRINEEDGSCLSIKDISKTLELVLEEKKKEEEHSMDGGICDVSINQPPSTTAIATNRGIQNPHPNFNMRRNSLIQSFTSLLRPPGHVFVTNASVCDIYCDAFLCPCTIGIPTTEGGILGTIWKQWYYQMKECNPRLLHYLRTAKEEDAEEEDDTPIPMKNHSNAERVATPLHWPWEEFQRKEEDKQFCTRMPRTPLPVAGDVTVDNILVKSFDDDGDLPRPNGTTSDIFLRGMKRGMASAQEHLSALMDTVRQFVRVTLHELRTHQPRPRSRRERYLLALPVVGTGGGRAGDLTGQIVETMLRVLCEEVGLSDDVDCVLVCADVATYSHAQNVRWKMCSYLESDGGHWLPRQDHMNGQTKGEKKKRKRKREEVNVIDDGGDGGDVTNSIEEKNEQIVTMTAAATPSPQCLKKETESFPCFRILTRRMRHDALQLAKIAARGHLSMFIGAGVSMGAGLPSWQDLLVGVEDQFTPNGKPSERMLGNDFMHNGKLDPLGMADWIGILAASRPDREGRRRDIKERIARLIEERSQHPSLLMSLLTSLPCKSIVTQNYDRLIERAYECRNVAENRALAKIENNNFRGGEKEYRGGGGGSSSDAGASCSGNSHISSVVMEQELQNSEALSVIPYAPVRGADRWLLKMHGCVSSPESIVITSDDYRTYESGRKKALAGLVQANLMTSHLLFVGFSLTDPNYQRIIEEVRHALKPRQHAT